MVQELGQPSLTLFHERHIGIAAAQRAGLRATRLDDDRRLQDVVLTVHHATIQTLTDTAAVIGLQAVGRRESIVRATMLGRCFALTRNRGSAAAVGAILLALALPASAGAWTAELIGNTVGISADAGEQNEMTLEMRSNPNEFFDAHATYRQTSIYCPATPRGGAECGPYITHAVVSLGDGDDSLVMEGAAQEFGILSKLDPGSGRDYVRAGDGSEIIEARDAERDTIVCDPPPGATQGIDTVVADDIDVVADDCEVVLRPTTIPLKVTVTTTADEDDGVCGASCSLREAARLVQRAGAGTVMLPAGTFDVDGGLYLYRGIALRGAGARQTVVRNPGEGPTLRVAVPPGAYVDVAAEVSDLTLRGECKSCGVLDVSLGGASYPAGALTAERIAVIGERVPATWSEGVGVSLDNATLLLRDATITNNTGGALHALGGSLTVINSTLSGNTETSGLPIVRAIGGRFVHSTLEGPGTVLGATLTAVSLRGSIVAGPCDGPVRSSGGNVLGASCGAGAGDVTGDPLLGPLGDHGGPTDTRVPSDDSPAIDLDTACSDFDGAPVSTDQRGVARPLGAACDSGAVEVAAAPRDTVPPSIRSLLVSRRSGTKAQLRSLKLSLMLSEPARVHIALRRTARGPALHTMNANLTAGGHRLAVGRRLVRGSPRPRRYVLTVTAVDAAGNRSVTRHIAIRLKRG